MNIQRAKLVQKTTTEVVPPRLASIEIAKQDQHFSAAHFTVFSATERERLHGHNYRVAVSITGEIDHNGLCFDYAIYKKILRQICVNLDEYTLIAKESPHLDIVEDDEFYRVTHNKICMPLLKTDTLLLPVRNITIEELSSYLLTEVLGDFKLIEELKICGFEVRVSSSSDQWACSLWRRT